jgi:hypothetical protein
MHPGLPPCASVAIWGNRATRTVPLLTHSMMPGHTQLIRMLSSEYYSGIKVRWRSGQHGENGNGGRSSFAMGDAVRSTNVEAWELTSRASLRVKLTTAAFEAQ